MHLACLFFSCELHYILTVQCTFLVSLLLLLPFSFLRALSWFAPETCFTEPVLFMVSYTLQLILSHGIISDTSALAASQFTVLVPCNSQATCTYPAACHLLSLDCEPPSPWSTTHPHVLPLMFLLGCQLWPISWLSL